VLSSSAVSGDDEGLIIGGGNGKTSTGSVWVAASFFSIPVCAAESVIGAAEVVALSTVGLVTDRGSS